MENDVRNNEVTTPQEDATSAEKAPEVKKTSESPAAPAQAASTSVGAASTDAKSSPISAGTATTGKSSSDNDILKKIQDAIKQHSKDFLYEKVLIGLYAVETLLFVFIAMQFMALQKIGSGSSGSFMQTLGETVGVARTITGAYNIFTFVLWASVLVLCIASYNRHVLTKAVSKTSLVASILGGAGTILILLQGFTFSKAMRFLGGIVDLNLGTIFSSGAETSSLSPDSAKIMMVLYFVGLALLVASIVFYIRLIKTTKDNTIAQSDKEIAEALKTGKANAQKAMAAGADLAEKGAQKAKEVMQSDEVQNAVKTGKQSLAKNKKNIVIVLAAAAVVLVGILGFTLLGGMLKPDAVVSMKDMQVILDVEGKNGFGIAEAKIKGEPVVTEIKDPKKAGQIYDAVHNYDIKIDKSKNLKNGDKITVTVVVKGNSLNLKFDKKELKETVTVEGLEEIVNSAKDLDAKARERMTQKAKTAISESFYSDIKNLKVEKLKTFERPVPQEELAKEYSTQTFSILEAYKVTFDEKKFSIFSSTPEEYEAKERICVYEFSDFRKKGSAVDFSFHQVTSKDSKDKSVMEDLENRYQVEGYKVIE